MSIIRVEKNGDYTSVYNPPFRDRRISFEARAVLAFILTKRDNWEVSTENLTRESPNAGRDKVLRMLRELKTFGFLHRQKTQMSDGTWDWETIIYESPKLNPHFKGDLGPYAEKPVTVKGETPINTGIPEAAFPSTVFQDDDGLDSEFPSDEKTAKPENGKPYTAEPETAEPETAEPETANPPILINTDFNKPQKSVTTEELKETHSPQNAETLERARKLRDSIVDLKGRKRVAKVTDQEFEQVLEVFTFWREERGKTKAAKLTPQRGRNILDRIRGGYTVDELRSAIKGIAFSPHHMGQNENGTVYDDIELICRDEQKTSKFIELAEEDERNGEGRPNNQARNTNGNGHSRNGKGPAIAERDSERERKFRESTELFGLDSLNIRSKNADSRADHS